MANPRTYTLRLLGEIGLSDDAGRDVEVLLRKPKHAALLAYLATPRPGTWHRRDSTAAIFWPDNDQSRARSALRSALLVLRRGLPEGAIVARGDDDLCVVPDIVATDVAAMSDDLAAGRFHEALARYQGELLPGLFVPDAPEFEHWLDRERRRVRALAHTAAAKLSVQRESDGDLEGAIDAARRASELNPDDEAGVRRLIALLDRYGDRAQAFAVYDRFRNHLADSFGVRPSAETVALMDAVRTRGRVSNPTVPTGHAVATDSLAPVAAGAPPIPVPASPARVARLRRWLVASVVAIVLAGVLLRPERHGNAAGAVRTLIVLPADDQTGDSALAFVAPGFAEGAAQRLEGLGGLRIASGARSQWTTQSTDDLRAISRAYGGQLLLRTTFVRSGDSLEATASILDAETLAEQRIGRFPFTVSSMRSAESELAAQLAGVLFGTAQPTFAPRPGNAVSDASYALMLRGWHQFFVMERGRSGRGRDRFAAALALFDSAVTIDPTNARAHAGVSTIWGNQAVTGFVPFADGYERAVAAAKKALALDPRQGSALANLGIMTALKERDLARGLEYIRQAASVDPSNPEVFLIEATMLRSAHLYDRAMDADRMGRRLDPLNSNLRLQEATTLFCADRPRDALAAADAELEVNATAIAALEARTRALALLGRYDEAIATWRRWAATTKNDWIASQLARAGGKDGYWTVRHAEGRRRLDALQREGGWRSPLRFAQASFASGDPDAAYRYLDQAIAEGTPALFRLGCMPDVDEFRHSQRFTELLDRIGSISAVDQGPPPVQ